MLKEVYMKTAIVLSGGGAKGAYQIGFWKAIRELKINYDIVCGTSIGALNGAFMVQENYKQAFKLWYFMDYKKVIPGGIEGSYYDSKTRKKVILKYAKGAIKGGLSVPGLEKIVEENLNYDLFYNSNIDYGLVTVKFPKIKPIMLTKSEIPKELLKDYLLASAACFPAFKMKKINNETYIDGGYYDNMPTDLAIKMGADNIICVDLRAPGKTRKITNKNIPIKIISSKNGIGNFLALEAYQTRRSLKLGYNDTMKAFNKLDGTYYTFKKNSLNRNYNRMYERYINNLNNYFENKEIKKSYKAIYGNKSDIKFNNILENLMKAFSFNDTIIYRTSFVNVLLKKKLKKEENKSYSIIKKVIKTENLNKNFISKELICYIYYELLKNKKHNKLLNNLLMLFPDSFMCAVYLKTIVNKGEYL